MALPGFVRETNFSAVGAAGTGAPGTLNIDTTGLGVDGFLVVSMDLGGVGKNMTGATSATPTLAGSSTGWTKVIPETINAASTSGMKVFWVCAHPASSASISFAWSYSGGSGGTGDRTSGNIGMYQDTTAATAFGAPGIDNDGGSTTSDTMTNAPGANAITVGSWSHGSAISSVTSGTLRGTINNAHTDYSNGCNAFIEGGTIAFSSGSSDSNIGMQIQLTGTSSGTGWDPRTAAMAWHPNSPIAFLRPNWPTQSTPTVIVVPPTIAPRRRFGLRGRARQQPRAPTSGIYCTWGTELAAWGSWQGPLNAQRTWEQILICSGPPLVPPINTPRRRRAWLTSRHNQPSSPTQVTNVTVSIPMPVESPRRRGAYLRRRAQPQVPLTQTVTVTVTYVPPIQNRTPRRALWIGQRAQPRVHDDRSGTFPPPTPATIRQSVRRGFSTRRRTQPVTPLTQTVAVVVTFTPPIPRVQRHNVWQRRRAQPAVTPRAIVLVPAIVEPRRRQGFITRRRQQPKAPFSVTVLVAPTYRPPIRRSTRRFGWWRKPRPVVTTLFSPVIVTNPPGEITIWLGKSGTTTTVLSETAEVEVTFSKSGTTTTVCDTSGHVTVTLGSV